MKNSSFFMLTIILSAFFSHDALSQKNLCSDAITPSSLRSHVSFLASPLLEGRKNGEPGLEIAAEYLEAQAMLAGLKPANGNSFIQEFPVIKKIIDPVRTSFKIISVNTDTTTVSEPIYQIIPTGPSDFSLEGEVVFAGYGIKADKYGYNDFAGIDTEGKILLIMDRAPMNDDGSAGRFEEPAWMDESNFRIKLSTLMLLKPKAILIVPDPKSGFASMAESNPSVITYLESRITLKGQPPDPSSMFMSNLPKVVLVHRKAADELLHGTGHSLEELQKSIDTDVRPHSLLIPDKKLVINEVSLEKEILLKNIAGYIEGSDKNLKNEVVVFSGHYDHIGGIESKINTGADDNASGCAALLSIANAFGKLEKRPSRSILFLWVSGEEIGLYGSESYVNNPLFPLKNTVADLNMDMIGRVRAEADSTDETPVTGPRTVYVITDNQSSDLRKIADEADRKSEIDFDYSLSGINHPLQLFRRSDHFNFVKNDIPVLFFTTGLHTDYHSPRDVIDKLDFDKMEIITETMFSIGLKIANSKTRPRVDNPYSKW